MKIKKIFQSFVLFPSIVCVSLPNIVSCGRDPNNAKGIKDEELSPETIFIAVSDDAEHWQRYYETSVYKDPEAAITGDATILKYGKTYIMVYFTLKNGKTCDTFAISKDLIHWTPWTGTPLIESTPDT